MVGPENSFSASVLLKQAESIDANRSRPRGGRAPGHALEEHLLSWQKGADEERASRR